MAGPIPNTAYAFSKTFSSRSKVPESKSGRTSILRPLVNTTSKAHGLGVSPLPFAPTNDTGTNRLTSFDSTLPRRRLFKLKPIFQRQRVGSDERPLPGRLARFESGCDAIDGIIRSLEPVGRHDVEPGFALIGNQFGYLPELHDYRTEGATIP